MKSVYYIGIDGGGTKTEAILTNREGRVMARALTDATNPNDVGVETSVTRMTWLTQQLLSQTDIAPSKTYLFAGISGALNHQKALTEGLCQAMPDLAHVEIGSDIINLMYAELPMGDGACVICGTGSACFLRCDDVLYRIGGWGYLLDSAGSGYDLGRMALEYALKAYDGRGSETVLTDLLAARLGKPVQDALSDIYAQGKPYIASCAPLVFHAASMGDMVAEEILTINARALADMITAACEKREALGRPTWPPLMVAMGGSINQKEAPFWTELIQRQMPNPKAAKLVVAQVPMVIGAAIKAMVAEKPLVATREYYDFSGEVRKSYLAFLKKHG